MMLQINCHAVGLHDIQPQHELICELCNENINLWPTLSQSQLHQQLHYTSSREGLLSQAVLW
jgi:hypothetical protein